VTDLDSNKKLDHLFRHEYGKVVSALTNKYSTKLIDHIEDAVQEALLKAALLWAYKDIPDNPSGWLYRVANNYLIDQLRRSSKSNELIESDKFIFNQNEIDDESITSGIKDDILKMIFAIAHPALSSTEQIMLCLKLINGFSLKEISNALIKKEETVKKAITRAKAKFRRDIGKIEVPPRTELKNRLDVAIRVLYLMFNEGYKATEGEQLIKQDLCMESIRLAEIINEHEYCKAPELSALLALMYYNSARFSARINDEGELVTLENQNRNLWNKEYIIKGTKYITEASYGAYISKYHIEAGIASEYTSAPSFAETNWELILTLYDMLLKVETNPFAALNRIVVLEKVKGTKVALAELENIEHIDQMQKNHLFYSIKADLKTNIGEMKESEELLKKAISFTSNSMEKKFLESKLTSLNTKK